MLIVYSGQVIQLINVSYGVQKNNQKAIFIIYIQNVEDFIHIRQPTSFTTSCWGYRASYWCGISFDTIKSGLDLIKPIPLKIIILSLECWQAMNANPMQYQCVYELYPMDLINNNP